MFFFRLTRFIMWTKFDHLVGQFWPQGRMFDTIAVNLTFYVTLTFSVRFECWPAPKVESRSSSAHISGCWTVGFTPTQKTAFTQRKVEPQTRLWVVFINFTLTSVQRPHTYFHFSFFPPTSSQKAWKIRTKQPIQNRGVSERCRHSLPIKMEEQQPRHVPATRSQNGGNTNMPRENVFIHILQPKEINQVGNWLRTRPPPGLGSPSTRVENKYSACREANIIMCWK